MAEEKTGLRSEAERADWKNTARGLAGTGEFEAAVEAAVEDKIRGGQHTTVTASDTVVTGLGAALASAVASFEDDAADANLIVTCQIGNQSGAPAAGSIIIKTWKTDGTDPTPVAATSFGKKVNWIAIKA